jgi:hypothetical protein
MTDQQHDGGLTKFLRDPSEVLVKDVTINGVITMLTSSASFISMAKWNTPPTGAIKAASFISCSAASIVVTSKVEITTCITLGIITYMHGGAMRICHTTVPNLCGPMKMYISTEFSQQICIA